MKVSIISEAPQMMTGFGQVCHHFAVGLHRRGVEVCCFGTAFTGWADTTPRPYRTWLSGRGGSDFAGDFPLFLAQQDADCILLAGDVGYVVDGLEHVRAHCDPDLVVVGHVVADGFPVPAAREARLRDLDAVACGTRCLAEALRARGIDAAYVPEGVDTEIFHPLAPDERRRLRRDIGLEDRHLIGLFGRNAERKQHPRVFEALRLLHTRYVRPECLLYVHAQPVDDPNLRGWDLGEVAESLQIADHVLFPNGFWQMDGVPSVGQGPAGRGMEGLGFRDRMAICDVIVNAAFAGGFELTTLEAQACGVPLIITNDCGNMAEVAGDGAVLVDGAFGIWGTGIRQFLVDPDDLARAVARVADDREHRSGLVEAGLRNAARYSWEETGELLFDVVAAACAGKGVPA